MNTRAALQSASIVQIFLQMHLLWCLRRKRWGERKISGILKQCLFFLQASGYMCSTSAGWAFGWSVEPCFKHVQSSSERYQLRNAFPNSAKVVGCRLSVVRKVWPGILAAVFSGPFFSRPVGGQRRIDGESSICVRSNIPRINLYWIFHFRTLDCPSALGPKKSAIRSG